MAKRSRKKRVQRPGQMPIRKQAIVDVTPERLAKGDDFDFVNPATIDPAQPIGRARRFRVSALDRLHRRGKVDWVQWYAGDCYRNAWHRAGVAVNVVASYGERVSGSEPPYGLPRTMSQLKARGFVREMRDQVPADMRAVIDRLLIEDNMTVYAGRQAERHLDAIRQALDAMARWMRLQVAA